MFDTFVRDKSRIGFGAINSTDDPIECLHGTPYTDGNGVQHCPSNAIPNCPSGQHPIGNYVGEYICAPNTCPTGTHQGWNTSGTQTVCTPNVTNACPTGFTLDAVLNSCIANACPAGYIQSSAGNCIRDVSALLPSNNMPIVTESIFSKIINYTKDNPVVAAAVIGGAFLLLKK